MAARLNKQKQLLAQQNYVVDDQGNNIWHVIVAGPEQTAFEGGQFVVKIKLESFPFKSPDVSFVTKIYHPNIQNDGGICVDMLEIGEKWAPVKNLVGVMDKIKSMLAVPNLDTPMNADAAQDYKNNTWYAKAKALTQQYAK